MDLSRETILFHREIKKKIHIVRASDDLTSVTFQIIEEDHTLANALRYIIMKKSPDVEFCGYSIPHPSEPKLNFRIQTYKNVSAVDVLLKGLDDLIALCDHVADTFQKKININKSVNNQEFSVKM
ncbi:hypothetical protein PCANB_000629 [Pneumocystis canis]|nr:hypothetical protein PCANB_000629 [Pneumocystis canis]